MLSYLGLFTTKNMYVFVCVCVYVWIYTHICSPFTYIKYHVIWHVCVLCSCICSTFVTIKSYSWQRKDTFLFQVTIQFDVAVNVTLCVDEPRPMLDSPESEAENSNLHVVDQSNYSRRKLDQLQEKLNNKMQVCW